MAAVEFIVRRDENAKYFGGKFEPVDIVVGMIALVAPMPFVFFTELPWWMPIAVTSAPSYAFILIFRSGRPRGFFMHWLRYMLRPKRWRYCPRHAEALLGAKSRAFCAARLPDRKPVSKRAELRALRWQD